MHLSELCIVRNCHDKGAELHIGFILFLYHVFYLCTNLSPKTEESMYKLKLEKQLAL